MAAPHSATGVEGQRAASSAIGATMAKISVSLDDELLEAIRADAPHGNVSGWLADDPGDLRPLVHAAPTRGVRIEALA